MRDRHGKAFQPVYPGSLVLFYLVGLALPPLGLVFGLVWGLSGHPQKAKHALVLLCICGAVVLFAALARSL